MLRISGERGLFFGDIHADDRFKGRHLNYWENVIDVTERILDIVNREKPDFVVLVGDLFGVRRGVATLKDRNALLYMAKFLQSLPNCVVLKGNHDYAEESDYEFLSNLGVFYSTKQIDGKIEFTHPKSEQPCLIHCVDYGSEYNALSIDKDASNIGAMHNEFYVTGKEQQIHSEGAIELSSRPNFFGLDLIFSGHIHQPTAGMIDFQFQDGFDSAFINLGCPSRPSHAELYDEVWYTAVEFIPNEDNTERYVGFRQEIMKLRPYTEVFDQDADYIEDFEDESLEERFKKEKLEEILGSMVTTNMGSDDFLQQVDALTFVDDEVKGIAKKYLNMALNI